MHIIGIDPGVNGGIAFMSDDFVDVIPMPVVDKDLDIQKIKQFVLGHVYDEANVFIEKVHAFPGQGVTSMFSFGYVYGQLIGLFKGFEFPIMPVAPQTWKKVVLVDTDKSKDAAINFVKRMYPFVSLKATPKSIKDHDGMAEAVCIAHYGKRLHGLIG